MFRACLKIFISIIFAQFFNICSVDSTVSHMNFIDWLIVLIKLCCTQKLDGEKMRNYSYFFVFLAVLSQKFLDFPGSFSHIGSVLSQLFTVHKLRYLHRLFLVFDAFEVNLFQKFEVFLLIFNRIVFDEPKLTLCFNF